MKNQARCIAHEIKNQISICELYSQIIKKHLEKANIKNSSIENALNCIDRALKIMTNNLVDLKTLDNLCLKKCNLTDILKESVNLSTVYVQEKDIRISLNLSEEQKSRGQEGKPVNHNDCTTARLHDCMSVNNSNINEIPQKQQTENSLSTFQPFNHSTEVYIDENKFLACLVNIIKNAIEAIENKGEIRINQTIEGKNAIIKISNNGLPISDIEHIFDEGYTTKKTGNGLGLSICKEYLKEQNAELKLSKSTNDLTEFEITLPII